MERDTNISKSELFPVEVYHLNTVRNACDFKSHISQNSSHNSVRVREKKNVDTIAYLIRVWKSCFYDRRGETIPVNTS